MKNILAVVPTELHTKVRAKCFEKEINISTAVVEALELWVGQSTQPKLEEKEE